MTTRKLSTLVASTPFARWLRRGALAAAAVAVLSVAPASGQDKSAPDPAEAVTALMRSFQSRLKLPPPPQRFEIGAYLVTLVPKREPDAAAAAPAKTQDDDAMSAFALIEGADGVRFFAAADAFEVAYRRAAGDRGPGPDLVLMAWSGGAHCCSTFHAFLLRDTRFAVQTIDTRDGEGEIVPGTAGPAAGLKFADANFAYWNTAFAFSPMPYVLLKWSGGRYVADAAAMRKPAPSAEEFASTRKEVATALAEWRGPYVPVDDKDSIDAGRPRGGVRKPAPPPVLWDKLLDLIYSGHAPLAARLFDEVWPKTVAGKAAFWRDFTRQLRQGDIWRNFGLERALGAQPLFAHTPR
ncbi:MAG: hypothetical protein HY246_01185 [Proteobacteria bacterium]|nr:hypothetical protein [Pseudomonadota bacterium]